MLYQMRRRRKESIYRQYQNQEIDIITKILNKMKFKKNQKKLRFLEKEIDIKKGYYIL